MKVVIDRSDPIGDKVQLELERGLQKNTMRVSVKFDDGSGQSIVVHRQDVIDALKSI